MSVRRGRRTRVGLSSSPGPPCPLLLPRWVENMAWRGGGGGGGRGCPLVMKVNFFLPRGGPWPECAKRALGRPRTPPLWCRVAAAAAVDVAMADGGWWQRRRRQARCGSSAGGLVVPGAQCHSGRGPVPTSRPAFLSPACPAPPRLTSLPGTVAGGARRLTSTTHTAARRLPLALHCPSGCCKHGGEATLTRPPPPPGPAATAPASQPASRPASGVCRPSVCARSGSE